MKTLGSYQFEQLEGRFHEAQMLSERAQMRLDGFPDLLKRHGYPSEGQVLEIGTAQGIRARIMAELYPNTQVTAIDRSPDLLNIASHRMNLNFKQADVYELPFPDNHFDFVYARLVFMHLHDPISALKNILRVLKPGGRLLIEDADRDCMFFEPAPASFKTFWTKVQDGQRKLGGDPNVGRKLTPYFKQLGFSQIQTEVQPIIGSGPDIEFLVKTLMPSLNIYLDPLDRPDGERAIDDLYNLSQLPEASFSHFWFVVSGEKQ
ncbi:MAG: hypothetical protein B7Y39_17900 [Bdellovibrio sp. 28-41-41]|nr:MAG: hypothetical protein B7Y39_17900 [Bdellovibrio sp. 28-41-41]